jgi:tRNA1(Val) A37 N6-methylase TrmN6
LPQATAVGVERDPWLADLARQNVAANALSPRVEIVTADIRAYAPAAPFDAVISNPPYLEPARANAQPDARKAAATIEDDVGLNVWIDVALAHLAPDGVFAMIHRADRLDEIRRALRGRVEDVAVFSLWPKTGVAPKRVIVCATPRGVLPALPDGLVLHDADGRYTQAAERVLRHAGGLTT